MRSITDTCTFSGDEFRLQALDVYLNPAETQLEWLELRQEVTNDQLQELIVNHHVTEERAVASLQERMVIKVKKGIFLLVFGAPCLSRQHYGYPLDFTCVFQL